MQYIFFFLPLSRLPRLQIMTRLRFAASLAALLLSSAHLSAEAVKLSGRATGAGPLAKCKVRK